MRRVACLLLVLGCGHPAKSAETAKTGDPSAAGDDQPKCEPGRCLDDISKAVVEHKTEARACYDDARKRAPKLEGKIVINFEIDATGSVTGASQSAQDGQIADDALAGCLAKVIEHTKFAASAQGKTTRAYHRFEFHP